MVSVLSVPAISRERDAVPTVLVVTVIVPTKVAVAALVRSELPLVVSELEPVKATALEIAPATVVVVLVEP